MMKTEELNKMSVTADGDNHLSPKSSTNIVITPFINFRKSFKKFKQKKRPLSEEPSNRIDGNHMGDTSNLYLNTVPDAENTMNILKRISAYRASRKKKKKTATNSSLNIVKWSSCESISDCRVGKHNSLRRSRASLIMPGTPNDRRKIKNASKKTVHQYRSMSSINEKLHTPPTGDMMRYSSQQLATTTTTTTTKPSLSVIPTDEELQLDTTTTPINLSEEICEELSQLFGNTSSLGSISTHIVDGNRNIKRAIIKKAKSHSLSLPNISEHNMETCIDIDIDEVIAEEETDFAHTPNQNFRRRDRTEKKDSFIRHSTNYSTEKLSLAPQLSMPDKFSMYFSNESIFSSSTSINRPPVPCCPKPTDRRDLKLKSASTEALSARKPRKLDENNSNELARKRTKSSPDCTAQKKKEARRSDNFEYDEDNENETAEMNCSRIPNKENLRGCTSTSDIPNLFFSERLWKKALSCQQLPYAIAEAVWDHTSLDPEELNFSSGDVLHVLFIEDENWWWGTKGEKEGWFPASYVRQCVIQEIGSGLTCKDNFNTSKAASTDGPKTAHSSRLHDEEKLKVVRAKCVEELLTTELDYVQLLKNIIEGYLLPVRSEEQLFDKEDAEILFSNIEELYAFHQQFVKELQQVINLEHMERSSVGNVFLRNEAGFEIYSKYCNNQPKSSARLSALTKDKKYKCFFERCRLKQNMIRLSLDGFLLSPVQRICKYPLQLKELLKHTITEHQDYEALANARTCMQNVAALINERKRRLENVHNLACWQYSVINWKDEDIALRSNELIHTGVLNKIVSNRVAERIVYIFDHQLIYFRKYSAKRHHLSYCGRIDLDNAKLIPIEDNSIVLDNINITNAWKVWDGVKSRWHLFLANSKKEKEEWMSVFETERKHVKEESEKGLNVLLEVREAAIENAHAKHLSDLKRRRIRRKSVSSYISSDFNVLPTTSPLQSKFNDITAVTCSAETVPKRRTKNRRKSSLRWSLGSMFEKYL